MTSHPINLHHIEETVAPLQRAIATHPLIHTLTTLQALHRLMSQHVFAVWDFVHLIKTLYGHLSSAAVPWLPPQNPDAVRLLLEILLEEEADTNPLFAKHDASSRYCSHFTLYRQAMLECGASTTAIDSCLAALKQGVSIDKALSHPAILPSTKGFVLLTVNACEQAPLPALVANFVFGREAIIPHFFSPWLAQLKKQRFPQTDILRYYLSRHIDLDNNSHFPKAVQLLNTICGKNTAAWQQAQQGATLALQARLDFLTGLHHSIANPPKSRFRKVIC